MRTPRLELYVDRIADNAAAIAGQCHDHGATVAGVAKVVCAQPDVLDAMVRGGVDMIGDSRIDNLRRARATGIRIPLMLLRIPEPSRAEEVVRIADISLNSSATMIRLLSQAAVAMRVVHKVILMIDIGDLREGVWAGAVDILRQCRGLPGIELIGLGANLACYGGVVPSETNMRRLVEVTQQCRVETGLELPMISGGNSSALPLLATGRMPPEINNFRMGESIILGRNVLDRSPWPGTRQDTVCLYGEIIELERKPSVPIGDRGQNAFGEEGHFVDRGTHWRAIVNLGRQDVAVDGLTPLDPAMRVLGASSDHLIVDVEDAMAAGARLAVGDEIPFDLNYGALLASSTSPYVRTRIVEEPPTA